MAGKKNTQSRQANPAKATTQVPGRAASVKNTGGSPSFWATLLADKQRLFVYQKICVFMVAFLVFANGIPNGFNIDDIYYTTKDNPTANMGIKAIPKILTSHTLTDVSNSSFEYRPIPMMTFALQHQFLSSAPVVSHFINVLLYAVICLLIFLLLCRWFGADKVWLAFFATLLYAVHPLHTEVVDSIKSRDELLAALFAVLCLRSMWKWYLTGKVKHVIFALALLVMGFLCKMTIVVYIAVIPLPLYFFTDMPRRKIVISFAALCFLYFVQISLVNFLLPADTRTFLYIENPMMATHIAAGIKTATASYILGWYTYLHFIPFPLSFYYGYSYVPLLGWNHLLPLLSLCFHIMFVYVAVKNIRKSPILSFGITFYLICLVPFSNLLGAAAGMMAERFTFSSSLAYSILVVYGIYYLFGLLPDSFSVHKNSRYVIFTILAILLCYSGMSIERNTQWENKWTLFTHDIKHLQNSAKANMLYGDQLILKNNSLRQKMEQSSGGQKMLYLDSFVQYAAEERLTFSRVLAVAPNYEKALNNLGVAYIHSDSFEQAKKYLNRAIALTPKGAEDANTCYNLGIVYANLAKINNNPSFIDSSNSEFQKVLALDPQYIKAYKMTALNYMSQKDTSSAVTVLLSGIKNVPDESFLYMELGLLYIYKGDTSLAVDYYAKGGEVPQPDPLIFQMLQNYYHSKNNPQKEAYYRSKMSSYQYTSH